jgi:hypothetical protein
VINEDPYFHLEEFEELCSCLGSPRHDTWIHKVEVAPPLFVRKGGAMVRWHYQQCKWWLGQTSRYLLQLILSHGEDGAMVDSYGLSPWGHSWVCTIKGGVYRSSMS